jgi:hypothetical protein
MASTTETSCSPAEGLSVWLGSFQDRLSKGRIEEHVELSCWILGLKETIEFLVGSAPLTQYRVPFGRRIGGEILAKSSLSVAVHDYILQTHQRDILFGPKILLCEGNHVALSCSIKLPTRI